MRLEAFISYRRSDSFMLSPGGAPQSSFTERLRDALRSLGFADVFLDTDKVEGIPLGDHYDKRTRKEVAGCDLVVAPIGDNWLDLLRRKQVDKERDLVLGELATALRFEKKIVPVVVDGARMPRESELPASISEFHYSHAVFVSSSASVTELVDKLRPAFLEVAQIRELRRKLNVGFVWFALAAFCLCALVPHVVGAWEYELQPWFGLASVWGGFFFWPMIFLPFALYALRWPLVTLLEYTFKAEGIRAGVLSASPVVAGTVLAALAVVLEVNSTRQVPWTVFPALTDCEADTGGAAPERTFSPALSSYDREGTLRAAYEARDQKAPFWLLDKCWPNAFFYLTKPPYQRLADAAYRSERAPVQRAFLGVLDSDNRAQLSFSYYPYVVSFSIMIWILAVNQISAIYFITSAIRRGDSSISNRQMENIYRCLTYAIITLLAWIPFRVLTLYFKRLYICPDLAKCEPDLADYMNDAFLAIVLLIGFVYLSVGLLYKHRRIALSILGFAAVAFIAVATFAVVKFGERIAPLTELWQFYAGLAILAIMLLLALWYQFDPAVADERLIDEDVR